MNLTAKYLEHLHHNAKPANHKYAKENRQIETEAEKILWSLLRNRRLKGKKFRRQHTTADFILDFYCHECKLGIELDGSFHNEPQTKKNDRLRTTF